MTTLVDFIHKDWRRSYFGLQYLSNSVVGVQFCDGWPVHPVAKADAVQVFQCPQTSVSVSLVDALYRLPSKEKFEEREGHSSLKVMARRLSVLQLSTSEIALVLNDAAVLDDSSILHNPLRLDLALQKILAVHAVRLRLAME